MAYQINENLDIQDTTMGISRTGLEKYRADLQWHVINDTKDALRDYKDIVDVIGTSWNGTAAQKFVNNFHNSTEQACAALDEISKAIDALFETVRQSMIKQDEQMIDDGESPF